MSKKAIITDEIPWKKDDQSVTLEGERVDSLIDGISIKYIKSIEDKRGDLVEMYNPSWKLHDEPMIYAYQVTINPNSVRGWELHKNQDDRIFISKGKMRWVAYDVRPNSPTYKQINEFVFSELNRALMVIPKGVLHLVKNIGKEDAVFINFPTSVYKYDNPDKIRPVDSSIIPFNVNDGNGW